MDSLKTLVRVSIYPVQISETHPRFTNTYLGTRIKMLSQRYQVPPADKSSVSPFLVYKRAHLFQVLNGCVDLGDCL